MAVLPASMQADLEQIRKGARAKLVELVKEDEFVYRFPDCEVGASPPFGVLWGMKVFLAEALAKQAEMTCNTGYLNDLLRLSTQDYLDLVRPVILRFSSEQRSDKQLEQLFELQDNALK